MTPQQAKEILPIITAYAEGKRIEILNQNGQWRDETEYGYGFCLERSRYRIKPEPQTRPWSKPSDLPDGTFYIRKNGEDDCWAMCIGAGLLGIEFTRAYGEVGYVNWGQLKSYRYSTDRKTWHKCEVTEEAK